MSTLQAGGIDVSAQLIYSPITITERTPTSAPPPIIRLLYWKWIERRKGALSLNENWQKWSFKRKKSRVHLNSNVTTSDQIRLLRDRSNKKVLFLLIRLESI